MHPMRKRLRAVDPVLRQGRVTTILPTHIEADGPNAQLGALCAVESRANAEADAGTFRAEVVRVGSDRIVLSPLEDGAPTFSGALVTVCAGANQALVGEAFLGRAVDALGRPLEAKSEPRCVDSHPLYGTLLSPLERVSPAEILETGVRAIDGLLTLGRGQRIGVFAASGVGKTTLLTQIARQVSSDVLILCLVGERGREVEAIWQQGLDDEARARSTLVAATSDQSAAMRVRAAHYALAHAEYWRDRGKHVVLVLDSATRLAMALREMGLAAGEPPTVRAYTPNVFAAIPKMVERCGAFRSGGAITAILTVLSETDDVDDPVCEMMKSLLDGHIVLSRTLAEQGHYPAIDVLRSVSRQAEGLVDTAQRRNVLQIVEWLSVYENSRTLVDTGLYVKGSNQEIDRALERHPAITQYLRQARDDRSSLEASLEALCDLTGGPP